MSQRTLHSGWGLVPVALAAVLFFTGSAWGQQAKPATDEKQAKPAAEETKGGPVVRTFGTKGGYRTEVASETKGTLSEEDRRQVSLLAAQVFQHIDEARRALDADDPKSARKEVDKGRQAIKAIRALLPKTTVHTKTTAPDGQVLYEDRREVQEDRVPLFEGMLSAKTLAPIVAAKQEAANNNKNGNNNQQEAPEVKGVRLVSAETITTQVLADLNVVEAQLNRVAKALDENKADDAAKALAMAQVRGVEFYYSKEDTPLAEARDAMWLAKRSLEENNAAQAQANLTVARQSLRLYREIAPQERRKEVDQMLKEVDELEAKLGKETAQHPASSGERMEQGRSVTGWWERINQWFRRR
jgi:hypothetical protein